MCVRTCVMNVTCMRVFIYWWMLTWALIVFNSVMKYAIIYLMALKYVASCSIRQIEMEVVSIILGSFELKVSAIIVSHSA